MIHFDWMGFLKKKLDLKELFNRLIFAFLSPQRRLNFKFSYLMITNIKHV